MDSAPTSVGFDRFGFPATVLKAVTDLGYETPTPIQEQCIPHLMEGKDLLGQAQTGTGKTAAFALPVMSDIDLKQRDPQALVLAPTRELALQVAEAFQSYAHGMKGFHVLPLYGGTGMSTQLRQLKRGAHVIVGTPGRVMDHLRRGTLSLKGLKTLVLDEADEMLNMGFVDDIEWIFEQAPKNRRVALFSATMPKSIRNVAQKYLNNPVEIKVACKTETVTTIEQLHCVVTPFHKMDTLTRVLEVESFDAMLVFVRTKTATVEVAEKLEAHGFSAEALNGDMNQTMRERTVARLKNGKVDIVVATDVAARGLDVERISHVVNYDIPYDPEAYVHRIGRTGRAGRKGKALLFVSPRERHLLKSIERATRQKIAPMPLPSADNLGEHRIEQFMQLLRDTVANEDLDFYYRLVSRIENEQEMGVVDIAAALTFLSQRERPFVVKEIKTPAPKSRPEGRSSRAEGRPSWAEGRPSRSESRPSRSEGSRPTSEKKERGKSEEGGDDIPRIRYRIEVGRQHGATPREIVGAIANEAGVEGKHIGYIGIHDDHSTVDLPEGMPKEIEKHLQKVNVCGQLLRLSSTGEKAAPPRSHKPKGKKPRLGIKKSEERKRTKSKD